MKALKFYCSVRVEVSRVGGSTVKEKIGGETLHVGHAIRAKVVKNKVAPPFRKAEFMVYYDGRKIDAAEEIAEVAMAKGLIGRYNAQGELSPTGRTYLWPTEPDFRATKKDDVAEELRKFPAVQDQLLEMIKNGVTNEEAQNVHEFDSEMSDEEFNKLIYEDAEDIKNGNGDHIASDAEEESWDDI
ncbi:MAG: hypothetical protein ACOCP8_02995 [archaeon]